MHDALPSANSVYTPAETSDARQQTSSMEDWADQIIVANDVANPADTTTNDKWSARKSALFVTVTSIALWGLIFLGIRELI